MSSKNTLLEVIVKILARFFASIVWEPPIIVIGELMTIPSVRESSSPDVNSKSRSSDTLSSPFAIAFSIMLFKSLKVFPLPSAASMLAPKFLLFSL